MKLSISTVCTPELDWRQCLTDYGRAGYDAVELLLIPGWKHLIPNEVSADEVRAACEQAGVRLVAVHAGALDGVSDFHITESLAYLEHVFAYASELGVPLVNVNGGYVPDGTATSDRAAALRRIGGSLAFLTPRLKDYGLRLTLENHYGYQVQTPEDYAVVLDSLPPDAPVGVTVDTGHFTAAGVDIPAFVREMGAERVFHVHVKDHVGEESVALGVGQTDNIAVLQALTEIGYDGLLSVEMEVRDRENAARYVREAFPYMTSLMNEVATL